jgi:lipid II:glycine glycyltransferase (peptidoglycan interpeptide bridge formation enzyme)
MTDKEKYIELCRTDTSICIFGQAWWLDAVCSDWNVSIVFDDNGNIIGAMPFTFKKRKLNIKTIEMPYLTAFLPIWIKKIKSDKWASIYAHEQKIMAQLVAQLPKVFFFNQYYEYDLNNALPFQWQGYEDRTTYSYRIALTDSVSIFNHFKGSVRTDIRKAGKLLAIEVSNDIERFYNINKRTFERQQLSVSYSLDFIKKVDAVVVQKNQRRIYFAKSVDSDITSTHDDLQPYHAAIYVVWDQNCMYFLIGGSIEDLRSSGAMSLLLWSAIQDAIKMGLETFDFCNASLKDIERFKRGFGGVRAPYFKMSKFRYPFLSGVYRILKN